MNTEQILMCVVALILGMLLANMLKDVYGCKLVEGSGARHCAEQCKAFQNHSEEEFLVCISGCNEANRSGKP